MPNPIVDVRDLCVNIKLDEGLLTPVRGVNFQIYPGQTLGLVGESGCGKSLTSKAILAINEKSAIPRAKFFLRTRTARWWTSTAWIPKAEKSATFAASRSA